jgi:sigma54-dependent transcription regulator
MRSVTRSYRIHAYPNGAQRRLLARWFGASRWLWNTALGIRSEAYRVCRLKLTGDDLSRWLAQWKHTAGHVWLAAVPATCLTRVWTISTRSHCGISEAVARKEIGRLHAAWRPLRDEALSGLLTDAQLEALDLFDRPQLQAVLTICRQSNSAADAGRKLFAVARKQRSSINDSDRLRKYLGRFGLDWARVAGRDR